MSAADLSMPPGMPLEAEKWIEGAVELVGHRFHPDQSFETYRLDLPPAQREQLDRAREAARALLGEGVYDIAYRASEAYLADRDPEWEPQDGPLPATQPPARWWLIESGSGVPVCVAYEDEYGTWWEYDPDTCRLHEAPWLFTDYYYRRGENRDRFTRLNGKEARERIAAGLPSITDRERPQVSGEDSLDLEMALRATSG